MLRLMGGTPSTRLPGSIFALLVVCGLLQAHFYAAKMPKVMASHFGPTGQPNGFQTLSAFLYMELGVVAIAALMGFGVPRLVGSIPVSLVNLPNKQFWLAPERREATLAYFRLAFAWFGCGLLAFLLVVNELVFRANLATPRRLNGTAFLTAVVAFLVFATVWTIRMIGRFARTGPF
jgi:uncharacterized membrane protein